MAPYEALYGRKYRTPICWDKVGENKLDLQKLNLIQQLTEIVEIVKQRLLIAQSCQKSYADVRRHDLEIKVGDKSILKDISS